MSTLESVKKQELDIYFLPYLAPGHMIPLTEIARLFASHGQKVTIITTPRNALLLQKYTDDGITLHTLKFSPVDAGLPEGCENLASTNSLEMATKLHQAIANLQPQIELLLQEHLPDCIISDMFFPWTADVATGLGITRIVFNPRCFLSLCTADSIHRFSPHENVQSDDEIFVVPGLPDPIQLTRSQLPTYRSPMYAKLMEIFRDAEMKSYGVIVNSFYELESAYIDYFKTVMGRKAWALGPVSLCNNKKASNKADRVHKSVIHQDICIKWLDSKTLNSVLYVSFGGGCKFSDAQLFEIASALEASGCQFIWVVLGKNEEKEEERENPPWLPGGFEQRMREKGMIVRGWAPQILILDHPAIGGFLTHCGWNSALEAFTAGVPMITWPLASDQFYCEKLIVQVHKIGVEVGFKNWNITVDNFEEEEIVRREKIERAVNQLMSGEDKAVEMRKRAKELGVMAKKAVEENGSSYLNLVALIDELKSIKANMV